jgi:hypothetical protein
MSPFLRVSSEMYLAQQFLTLVVLLLLMTQCNQVYRVTDVKMVGLRGYTPDEEKVQEVHCTFF